MRVLVTGGAGYLGSLLVPALLDRGDEVTIVDTFLWGVQPILHVAANPRLTIVNGDVRDTRVMQPLLRQSDAVVNLAAIVGYPACQANPHDARTINLDSVRDIAHELSPAQMLIQASTGSTYGAVPGVCTEETPINPLTLYGETKAESEKYVLDKQGVPLRFATVFGVSPRMRLDLIVNDITFQAVKFGTFVMYEGHARRTFLHAKDAARAITFTLDNYKKMSGQPFNIGDDGMNYSKRDVAEIIRQKHNYYLHATEFGQDKDKRDYEVSYERVKALGYSAETTLSEGVDELLKVLPHIQERSPFRNVSI